MRAAPFVPKGPSQHDLPMGIGYHLVPHMHALYFGPVECARHTFADLVDDPAASLLVIDDVNAALGESERLIGAAVREILEQNPEIEGFMLCSACQTAFMGIDLDALCLDLHEDTGRYFGHIEANRMSPDNIPGATRKSVPGGDRYHSHLALARVLAQAEKTESQPAGVLVLTDEELAPENDLRDYVALSGVSWVHSIGDCRGFEDFTALATPRVIVSTAIIWKEAGEWLASRFNVPFVHMPVSYDFDEIEAHCQKLDELLSPFGTAEEFEIIHEKRKRRLCEAKQGMDSIRTLAEKRPLDLDLRMINRPFSLVETLMKQGIRIRNFTPGFESVRHKEEDDLPAFERLAERYPAIAMHYGMSMRAKQTANKQHRTGNVRRPGRFIPAIPSIPTGTVKHVPEETSWWGYSSVVKIASEIAGTRFPKTQGSDRRKAIQGAGGSVKRVCPIERPSGKDEGKWTL